uniref:Uncharacterized protein n=1 Tax=Fagus sylvatica TaxID=28930 RepID=A0A2N9FN76_FAGSY
MASERRQLHLFFFPFLASGHLIPAVDMAKLFASRGLKISIITTPLNASLISKTIEKSKILGLQMDVLIIEFPYVQVELPKGLESYHLATSLDLRQKFYKAAAMLEQPLEKLVQEYAPDCLVSSALYPWTTGLAKKFGIPRLIFHATSFFSICASECLKEIAIGLEGSEQHFIWVVKKEKNDEGNEEWLPEGFEKRVEGKGLIIRGWAPQIAILDHEAVGGFVTHCGWNSTLEGVSAGVPMVTWPVSAEQFYNEKFLGDSIKREAIQKAVIRIMVGEEAEEMRSRARELGKMAKKAVEENGSSYSDLNNLIEELKVSWHCW